MKKIIVPLAVFFLALVLSSCEKWEMSKYEKLSYINEDAFLIVEGDTVYNPMRNVPWLERLQNIFDDKKNSELYKDKYYQQAVISFIPYQDSVQRILYMDTRTAEVRTKNTDGSSFYIKGLGYSFDYTWLDNSKYLEKKISSLVGEVTNKESYIHKPSSNRWHAVECIDTILNNATNIEVLSCYKFVK